MNSIKISSKGFMSHSKNIVSILLVILLMGTGLPIFQPSDVSKDGLTDLQDVILTIKDLARTAETPGNLTNNFKQVLTTLTAVAGLKTVIKHARDSQSANSIQSLYVTFLKKSDEHHLLTASWSPVKNYSHAFVSIKHKPVIPPPKIS